MIYGTRLIGKELLDIKLVKEFKDMYLHLRKSSSHENGTDLIHKYFLLNDNLSLQFDGLVALFINLINAKPSHVENIEGFVEFIEKKCTPLAVISNLIIFMLNNYILNDDVISILETPYDHVLDKNSVKDELKLKNAFKIILKTDNVDNLFKLITNLRDDFFDSELYHQYKTALINDGNVRKYEIDIQALFYIIKQIIYQYVIDGQIISINDNNIISFKRKSSLEGNFFEIKYQPSTSLNYLFSTDIIEIIYEGKKKLGKIRHLNHNFSPDKGISS